MMQRWFITACNQVSIAIIGQYTEEYIGSWSELGGYLS